MAHHAARKSKLGLQDVDGASPRRSQGRLSRFQGSQATAVQGKNCSVSVSHSAEAQQTRLNKSCVAGVSGSSTGHLSMGRSVKGERATRTVANSAVGSRVKEAAGADSCVLVGTSRTATRTGTRRGGNSSRQTHSGSFGSRPRSCRQEQDVEGSSSAGQWSGGGASGRGRLGRQSSGISTVTRKHSESLIQERPTVTEKRRTKNRSNVGRLDAASSSLMSPMSRGGVGRNAAGQQVTESSGAADQLLVSHKPGKSIKRKRGKPSFPEPSSCLPQSSQVQHSAQEEPPSKRTRLSGSQPTGAEYDKRLLGKKSFLRRAQEDMLASGSALTDSRSGETSSGSKAGLSQTQKTDKPLARRSLHNASSNRLRNYRYRGSVTGFGGIQGENQGERPQFNDSDSVLGVGCQRSQIHTRGAKRGRGARRCSAESINFKPGSSSQTKPGGSRNGRAVRAMPVSAPSDNTNGKLFPPHQHVTCGKMAGRTKERHSDVGSEVLPVAKRLRTLTCVPNTGRDFARNCERPKRNLSKRKKCECCNFDEHSDLSFSDSDTELQKCSGKDEDRAWRSPIRSNRKKLKGGAAGKVRGRQCRNRKLKEGVSVLRDYTSNHNQQHEDTKYTYPVPVKMHTSMFKQEISLPGIIRGAGKEDVKRETLQVSNSCPKVESSSRPGMYAFNQDATRPGQIAYMEEDFYVVVADSDCDEDSTDVSTTDDTPAENIKAEEESAVKTQKEEADFETNGGPSALGGSKKERKEESLASMSSSQSEVPGTRIKHETETSISAPKKDKTDVPVTAQGDKFQPHSEHNHKHSSTAQKPASRSDTTLSVEKQKCLQSEGISETEAEVLKNEEESTATERDNQNTLAALKDKDDSSGRQNKQSPDTTMMSQKEDTDLRNQGVERMSDSLSSAREQDWTRRCDLPATQKEMEIADQASADTQNVQQCPAVGVSLTPETQPTVSVNTRGDNHQTVGVNVQEESDRVGSADTSGQSYQRTAEASEVKDQTKVSNISEGNDPALISYTSSTSNQLQDHVGGVLRGKEEPAVEDKRGLVQIGLATSVPGAEGLDNENKVDGNLTEIPCPESAAEGSCAGAEHNQRHSITEMDPKQGAASTARPGEDPQQLSLEHGDLAGANPVQDHIPSLTTPRQENPELEPVEGQATQIIPSAEESEEEAFGEKIQPLLTPGRQDDGLVTSSEIPTPVQAETDVALPKPGHPGQVRNVGAECNKGDCDGHVSTTRQCDLPPECTFATADVQATCRGDSGENSQKHCDDVVMAQNILQENFPFTAYSNVPSSSHGNHPFEVRGMQYSAMHAPVEDAVLKNDDKAVGPVAEKTSEAGDEIQGVTDNGEATGNATEQTVLSRPPTNQEMCEESKPSHSEQTHQFPEATYWQKRKLDNAVRCSLDGDEVPAQVKTVPIIPEVRELVEESYGLGGVSADETTQDQNRELSYGPEHSYLQPACSPAVETFAMHRNMFSVAPLQEGNQRQHHPHKSTPDNGVASVGLAAKTTSDENENPQPLL